MLTLRQKHLSCQSSRFVTGCDFNVGSGQPVKAVSTGSTPVRPKIKIFKKGRQKAPFFNSSIAKTKPSPITPEEEKGLTERFYSLEPALLELPAIKPAPLSYL